MLKKNKNIIPAIFLIASGLTSGAIVHSQTPREPDSIYVSLASLFCDASPKTQQAAPGLGALDFLSSVYEETDYYSTGSVEESLLPKNQKSRQIQIYYGKLPDEVHREFVRPVPGRLSSPFGPRWGRLHKGVDLILSVGDPVCAAISGTVSRVGFEKGGYGLFIVIDRKDGIQTRYAHLSESLVNPGDIIYPGMTIARGGSSGNSTGPHLHFEIRVGGAAMDPGPLVGKIVGKAQ